MKKILVLLTVLSSLSFAATPDATLKLPVSLKVVSGIIINKSGDIDFGDVIVKTGEVASDPMTLTVTKPEANSATSVNIEADENITMTNPSSGTITASIVFKDGEVSGGKATINPNFSNNVADTDMTVVLKLMGNEAAEEYTGTVNVTATTI